VVALAPNPIVPRVDNVGFFGGAIFFNGAARFQCGSGAICCLLALPLAEVVCLKN